MASRTITTLTDDIDGGDADETVPFAFNGTPVRDRPVQEEPRQDGQGRSPHTTAARTTAARTTGGRRSGSGPHHPPGADRTSSPGSAPETAPTATRSHGGRISTAYQPYSSGTNQAGVLFEVRVRLRVHPHPGGPAEGSGVGRFAAVVLGSGVESSSDGGVTVLHRQVGPS